MFNLYFERLNQLTQHFEETWQGGAMPAALFSATSGDLPLTFDTDLESGPRVGYWVSLASGISCTSDPKAIGRSKEVVVLDALVQFACDPQLAGYRPGCIEITDEAVGNFLKKELKGTGIEVRIVEQAHVVRQVFALMDIEDGVISKVFNLDEPSMFDANDIWEDDEEWGIAPATSVPGVTHSQMRDFTKAAAAYYKAQPWRHLDDIDLIEIHQPQLLHKPNRIQYFSMLGHGHEAAGLVLFTSKEQHAHFSLAREDQLNDSLWHVTFGLAKHMPQGDLDDWETHCWELGGPEAYPLPLEIDPEGNFRRPGRHVLALMEGLLRAMTQINPKALMQGPCEMNVDTFTGKQNFCLEWVDQPQLRQDIAQIRKQLSKNLGIGDDF